MREPYRICYTSSYDRGLEELLLMWGDIKREVPLASLHIYYGWNTYDSYVRKGVLKDDGFKDKMLSLMAQDGVYEHGRVGHKDLINEYRKATVFAYPCKYSGEIQCIALTKAIACGCIAVTNDFAVLKERNPHFAVSNDKFKYTLISVLKGKYKPPKIDIKGYIQENSWEKVAQSWEQDIFPSDIEVEFKNRGQWFFDKLKPEDKIVDIGSNDGHCFFDYPHRENVTYVDIDDYDIPNFVRANAEDLPFEDKKFDVACLFELLEHVDNPVKALSEARRVAKRTLITVPYEYEWADDLEPFWTIKEKRGKEGTEFDKNIRSKNNVKDFYDDGFKHLFHQTFYTPELLKEHLTQAGFSEVRIVKLRFGKWVWLGVEAQ